MTSFLNTDITYLLACLLSINFSLITIYLIYKDDKKNVSYRLENHYKAEIKHLQDKIASLYIKLLDFQIKTASEKVQIETAVIAQKSSNTISKKKSNDEMSNNISETNDSIFNLVLKKHHPLLSQKELRLCYLFSQLLNSTEISELEKLSIGSVRVYKTKIKQKIGLRPKESLSKYLEALFQDMHLK